MKLKSYLSINYKSRAGTLRWRIAAHEMTDFSALGPTHREAWLRPAFCKDRVGRTKRVTASKERLLALASGAEHNDDKQKFQWRAAEWQHKSIVDSNGEKIGQLRDVYVDVETDVPRPKKDSSVVI
jgi:hypothetical protein